MNSQTPTDRRSNPTATTIRVMIMECASKYADALADYWIEERGSPKEETAAATRLRIAADSRLLSTAFAYYVTTGKSPVVYIRAYHPDAEIIAKDLEARLAPTPPIQAEDAWIEPGHEED